MTDTEYYWCLRHQRVESGDTVCRASQTMGPYRTPDEARQALERVRQRNEEWETDDRVWDED